MLSQAQLTIVAMHYFAISSGLRAENLLIRKTIENDMRE